MRNRTKIDTSFSQTHKEKLNELENQWIQLHYIIGLLLIHCVTTWHCGWEHFQGFILCHLVIFIHAVFIQLYCQSCIFYIRMVNYFIIVRCSCWFCCSTLKSPRKYYHLKRSDLDSTSTYFKKELIFIGLICCYSDNILKLWTNFTFLRNTASHHQLLLQAKCMSTLEGLNTEG